MTLRIGLVGAGPWARTMHGPGLAAADGLTFTGVWARRAEATRSCADELGVRAYADVDDLIADVDAVAFAVAPGAQAQYATRAARAGRHLVLDKPLAADLPAAEELVDVSTDVTTAVFFTTRYTPSGREFLARAERDGPWSGAAATWVSGGILSGPYSNSPWRRDDGALWDVGPHAVEMVSAALGPVTDVLAASRSEPDYVTVTLRHDSGAVSQLALCLRVPTHEGTGLHLFGTHGRLELGAKGDAAQAYATMLGEFVTAVDGGPPPTCDAHRALGVQRVLDLAAALLAGQPG